MVEGASSIRASARAYLLTQGTWNRTTIPYTDAPRIAKEPDVAGAVAAYGREDDDLFLAPLEEGVPRQSGAHPRHKSPCTAL